MDLAPGQIIKNILPDEPIRINKAKPLGSMVSVHYTGTNSNISNNKMISKEHLETLEVISEDGSFDFSGNPEKFKLFAEAERKTCTLRQNQKEYNIFCLKKNGKRD